MRSQKTTFEIGELVSVYMPGHPWHKLNCVITAVFKGCRENYFELERPNQGKRTFDEDEIIKLKQKQFIVD